MGLADKGLEAWRWGNISAAFQVRGSEGLDPDRSQGEEVEREGTFEINCPLSAKQSPDKARPIFLDF